LNLETTYVILFSITYQRELLLSFLVPSSYGGASIRLLFSSVSALTPQHSYILWKDQNVHTRMNN
jgi:hypothetical protein